MEAAFQNYPGTSGNPAYYQPGYSQPNIQTGVQNQRQYQPHQIHGTTYYSDPGAAMYPNEQMAPNYNENPVAMDSHRRGRGRGKGRSRGRGFSQGNYYGNAQHYQDYQNNHSYSGYQQEEFNPNEMSQSVRPKVKSYQNSRQNRNRENVTQQHVDHEINQQPLDERAYHQKSSSIARQRDGGSGRGGYSQRRKERSNWNSRQSYNQRPPRNKDNVPANVERLNYTYEEEHAENKRKWEHETTGHLSESTDKPDPNKPKLTSLGKTTKKTSNSQGSKSDKDSPREPTESRASKQQNPRKTSGKVRPFNRRHKGKVNEEEEESQRGLMIEQLRSNGYECMVCCDNVRRESAIWSCANCFRVFHLRCTKKWARSPAASVNDTFSGWRCPACQHVVQEVPKSYLCFCGKVRDPDWNRYETPHSCGDLCRKNRGDQCTHPCNILCHPGPCPPCHASVVKTCDCGKTKQTKICDQATTVKCEQICSKTLNCGSHECQQICHAGPCEPCSDEIKKVCFCEKETRIVICGTSESFKKLFSCEKKCNKELECGNHLCENLCHPGKCDPCALNPSEVTKCPCGKTNLTDLPECEERTSCLDAVPICGETCDKVLKCGPIDRRHKCQLPCHEGECPPCDGDMEITCRCALFSKDVTCLEASEYTELNPFCCERRCNRKKTCGRHKCSTRCCVETSHPCDLICDQKLTCGLHRCEEPCHKGNCPTCWHVSFDELHCHCGAQILYPPVACGTRPPECTKPCTREHACSHRVTHTCHSEVNCPPCIHLKEMWCLGRHELRKNIPCYLAEISCGMPCGKELPCGIHKCQLSCHKDGCLEEGAACAQLCTSVREECGHPCFAPCHPGRSCPKTPCKAEVKIHCECGNRSEKTQCFLEVTSEYQKLASSMLAMKIAESDGQDIDISGFTKDSSKKKSRRLECNSECAILERNKRLALALEIKNPDLSNKLGNATFTPFLKEYGRQNLSFLSKVEKAFSDLVKAAEQSKQPRRSHAFDPMPAVQRRVVHELSDFYGCESQSYDVEPKKNVVITAHRDRCWHPNVTLTTMLQREFAPKAPMPIPHRFKEDDLRSASQTANQSTSMLGPTRSKTKITFTSKNIASTAKEGPSRPPTEEPPSLAQSSSWSSLVKSTNPKPESPIDYFEMTD